MYTISRSSYWRLEIVQSKHFCTNYVFCSSPMDPETSIIAIITVGSTFKYFIPNLMPFVITINHNRWAIIFLGIIMPFDDISDDRVLYCSTNIEVASGPTLRRFVHLIFLLLIELFYPFQCWVIETSLISSTISSRFTSTST